jgi:uncharacterized protein YlxW (UPF0749 family)
MVLVDWLCSVGGKLGIVQVVRQETARAPMKIQTRTVDLKDLVREIQAEEVRSLARRPEELTVGFEKVFEAAGIKPAAHGWTVERLGKVLQAEPYRSMDRPAAQKALLAVLADQNIAAEDLVKDAIARDQALDAFEEVARGKMDARAQSRQARLAAIRSQIEDLQKQQAQLQQEQASDQQHWKAWHDGKIALEKEMAAALGYLVDRPVVTIDQPHP